jgi:hypothetical protein
MLRLRPAKNPDAIAANTPTPVETVDSPWNSRVRETTIRQRAAKLTG